RLLLFLRRNRRASQGRASGHCGDPLYHGGRQPAISTAGGPDRVLRGSRALLPAAVQRGSSGGTRGMNVCRDGEQESVELRATPPIADHVERERRDLEDSLAMARADRDSWRERAADAARERDQLRRQADLQGRQLVRLRVADRRRLKGVIDDLVRSAADWRVGVLGAGEHTEWLLQETSLGVLPHL